MYAKYLKPHPQLKAYIRHYVYCKIGSPDKWSQSSMAPPGCAKLSITLGKEHISVKENSDDASRYESIIFVGQVTRYKSLAWHGRLQLFFVIFRPFGAFSLLRIPQDKCKNQCIGLSDIMGRDILTLEEQLVEEQKIERIRKVMDSFFLERLTHLKTTHEIKRLSHAIKKIEQWGRDQLSIKELCRQTGYSMSTIERRMKKIVGITPKEFQRIIRFNRALQFINKNSLSLNWSRIALHFGYYDQAHFIKEFKQFYGKTPATFTPKDNRFLSNVAQRKKLINRT